MSEVIWTENALEDLEAIMMFISKDSSYYAKIFYDKIFGVVDNLADYPLMGRVVPEFDDDEIREIIQGNYRIIYRAKENSEIVEILTIHHGAMEL